MFDPKTMGMVQDLLESMNDSIIVDKDGKVIFFSESYGKDAGVKSKDVIGKDVREVIKNTRMHIVLQTGTEEYAQAFSATLSNKSGPTSTPLHFCNRIPIRRHGDPSGEIIGAFAYTTVADMDDIRKMKEQLDSLKRQDILMMDHLSEIYRPQFTLDSIKGSSHEMASMRNMIRKVASSNITVTISGETGTGKELIASAIHELSPRHDKPFIKINCAAIPYDLLESELFGYEPGSFTGASKNGKIGKFELANHGTLLLDEIGEMPMGLQAKILRILQEKELERIGSKKSIPLDIRLLCSTNRNLGEMVKSGQFRSDLYYRINVLEIKSPPLREHMDDLTELCEFFVGKYCHNGSAQITGIDSSVYDLFRSYSWPGNIRELEHVIECACVMAYNGPLLPKHFDFLMQRMSSDTTLPSAFDTRVSDERPISRFEPVQVPYEQSSGLASRTMQNERNAIIWAISKCHGNISEAAKLLQVNRSSLYRKLKRYKIYPYE